MKTLLFALIAMLSLQSAYASDSKKIENPVAADTLAKFTDLDAAIRIQMAPGGHYEYMKSGDKQRVSTDLDRIDAMLQKAGSVDAMSVDDRLKLFNTQEHVNGLLTRNDSNRLVCERVAPLGSHIPQTSCRTYGQIERERMDTEKALQDANMHHVNPKSGG